MTIASSTSRWQRGRVVDDMRVHAVRPTISGYRAWCGAGDISLFDVNSFDTSGNDVCDRCADLVRPLVPRQRLT